MLAPEGFESEDFLSTWKSRCPCLHCWEGCSVDTALWGFASGQKPLLGFSPACYSVTTGTTLICYNHHIHEYSKCKFMQQGALVCYEGPSNEDGKGRWGDNWGQPAGSCWTRWESPGRWNHWTCHQEALHHLACCCGDTQTWGAQGRCIAVCNGHTLFSEIDGKFAQKHKFLLQFWFLAKRIRKDPCKLISSEVSADQRGW